MERAKCTVLQRKYKLKEVHLSTIENQLLRQLGAEKFCLAVSDVLAVYNYEIRVAGLGLYSTNFFRNKWSYSYAQSHLVFAADS